MFYGGKTTVGFVFVSLLLITLFITPIASIGQSPPIQLNLTRRGLHSGIFIIGFCLSNLVIVIDLFFSRLQRV